ncbi:MAG TPA: hypothetical protein VJ729_16670 [Nitrososphaeraceae archaeon]|nr:hypothetical protein [Nitrososphaeraceae archaeon]
MLLPIANKDLYERFMVLRHALSHDYRNQAKIEKCGLKPPGKDWDT